MQTSGMPCLNIETWDCRIAIITQIQRLHRRRHSIRSMSLFSSGWLRGQSRRLGRARSWNWKPESPRPFGQRRTGGPRQGIQLHDRCRATDVCPRVRMAGLPGIGSARECEPGGGGREERISLVQKTEYATVAAGLCAQHETFSEREGCLRALPMAWISPRRERAQQRTFLDDVLKNWSNQFCYRVIKLPVAVSVLFASTIPVFKSVIEVLATCACVCVGKVGLSTSVD